MGHSVNAASNLSAVAGLEPKIVWNIFAELAAVPRPSKDEERVIEFVKGLAARHGLSAVGDAVGNLVIAVPASEGCEQVPTTVLQGHLDMVCEKNAGTEHDFDRDGIRLVADKDSDTGEAIIRGDGTTLGADNGMGVALGFAAAISPDVVHGPLELLLTVDEEEGMTGAKALTPTSFTGRRLLNLDSEEDDALYIGCAGGCDTNLVWSPTTEALPAGCDVVRLRVTGLRGGHSGCDIHEGRANAIKLIVRTLRHNGVQDLRLIELNGGSKRNAIPREATAVVVGPAGLMDALKRAASTTTEEAKAESFESGALVQVDSYGKDAPASGLSPADTRRVLEALMSIPSGVLGMHPRIAGLVETSNNLSTVETGVTGSRLTITAGMLSRSSSASRRNEIVEQLACLGHLSGAEVSTANAYPGWSPNPDSPMLAVCQRVYRKLFETEPNVAAIHAGLECGIIGERVGAMDMVSLGPTIRGAHSPDERVFVASVERTWRYLKALLTELAQT